MTFGEAVTDSRERTEQDLPAGANAEEAKVKDSTIKRWVVEEVNAVRRILSGPAIAPSLFTRRTAFTVPDGSSSWVVVPVDFQGVRVLERREGSGSYFPLEVASTTWPEDADDVGFLEEGNELFIYPANRAAGEYRLRYISKQTETDDNDPIALPDGGEIVVCERVAAKIRRRLEEGDTAHLKAAEEALRELKWTLSHRYGAHQQGLIR